MAEAYAALKEWDSAIATFEWSLRHEFATGAVRTIEQLGNALARSAEGSSDVEARFEDAQRWLNFALQLGSTGERHALLGSLYKKRAVNHRGRLRAADFAESTAQYEKAAMLKPNAYHWCVWVQLVALRWSRGSVSGQRHVSVARDRFTAWSKDFEPDTATFWGRSRGGDITLTEHLVATSLGETPPQTMREIAELYAAAFELRSSDSERDTVIAHLNDLSILSSSREVAANLSETVAALRAWRPRFSC